MSTVAVVGPSPTAPPAPGRLVRLTERRWTQAAIVVAFAALGLLHALAIAPHYHVGSFDDDAGYILGAQTIAHGGGFGTPLPAGYPLVAVYPPGFSAILSPLALLGGDVVGHYRVLAAVMFLLVFPLSWIYFRRHGVSVPVCTATMALLALNPVAATFATMVMAETTFLVLLLLLLLALDRWAADDRLVSWSGAATVLLAESLIWVKEASAGLVLGIVVWLLWRRPRSKAVVLAAGTAILFLPVLISRLLLGVSLVGSRYSTDYAGAYHGGLLGRIIHLPPRAIGLYISDALNNSLVPVHVSPLPAHGPVDWILGVVQWTTAPLMVLGIVVWWRRRYGTAVLAMAGVYLLETLFYPFINERRVILVLPLVLAWYVLGAAAVGRFLLDLARRVSTVRLALTGGGLAAVTAGLVVVPLLVQFPRDYLLVVGQPTSDPKGSPYMLALARLGSRRDVVETDYLYTTSLYSGHRTAKDAYEVNCSSSPNDLQLDAVLTQELAADHASYLLIAALNKYGVLSSPCLASLAAADPAHFVRITRTYLDDASVYELIGPDTPHPDLVDLTQQVLPQASTPTLSFRTESPLVPGATPAVFPVATTDGGVVDFSWSWSTPHAVTQVSLGAAGSLAGATPLLEIQLRRPDGTWTTIEHVPSGVGGSSIQFPFLLDRLAHPLEATAARVIVHGEGQVAVHDLQVLARRPPAG